MIGANNYGFADIVQQCITNWLTSPSWWKNYCSDDSDMTSRFTARARRRPPNVKDALLRVRDAMTNAGYADSQYKIIAQTYWSPIPRGPASATGRRAGRARASAAAASGTATPTGPDDTVMPAMNSSVRNGAAQSGLTNIVMLDLQNS